MFTSTDGYYQRFDLVNFKKRTDADKNHHLEYMSSHFLNNTQEDETKVLIVGQDKENGASLMVLNKDENIEINASYKEETS